MGLLDKVNLDFHVLSTGDPKVLIVIDTSVWGFIEGDPAIIEIVTPGTSEIRTYNFVKGKSNVFNSSNLLLSPVGEYKDLADGIYRISVKGSPDSHCKHRDFLKTDKIRLEISNIYISLGFDNTDPEVIRKKQLIQDIDLLIRGAEALIKIGKLKAGYSRFKRAVKMVKDYNECETCK